MYLASGSFLEAVVNGAIAARALDVSSVAVNLSGDISVTSVLMSAGATIASNGRGFVDEINIYNNDENGHEVSVFLTSGAVSRGIIQTVVPRGATLGYKPAIGWFLNGTAVGSGWVTSGMFGNASVISSSIGSGQIGGNLFVSGVISSGDIGNSSVTSGNVASGQIGDNHFSSGAKIDSAEYMVADGLLTAEMISGNKCVTVNTSGQLVIAMAGKSGRFPSIGVVVDNVLSGQVARRYHKGCVYSPNTFNFSGNVGTDEPVFLGISGELVASNQLPGGSGLFQIIGLATNQSGLIVDLNYSSIYSGLVTRYSIGSGVINSGHIGSGQLATPAFGSGSATSGFYASGVFSTYKIGSGTVLTQADGAMDDIISGSVNIIITEEPVSAGPVNISQSGRARMAMAGVSGRMPAVGVVNTNIASGQPLFLISGTPLIYEGAVTFPSGILPINAMGAKLFVGMSGTITNTVVSGMVCQIIGTNYLSGMMVVRISQDVTSGDELSFLGV